MNSLATAAALNELDSFLKKLNMQGSIQLDPTTMIVRVEHFIAAQIALLQPGSTLVVQRTALARVVRLLDYIEKNGLAPEGPPVITSE
jgi:hypothetical protein